MSNNLIKPITLEIDKDLWIDFKITVPRTKTLNTAIVELIEKEIENRKRGGYLK